jgi:hypothetical protein
VARQRRQSARRRDLDGIGGVVAPDVLGAGRRLVGLARPGGGGGLGSLPLLEGLGRLGEGAVLEGDCGGGIADGADLLPARGARVEGGGHVFGGALEGIVEAREVLEVLGVAEAARLHVSGGLEGHAVGGVD